MALNIKATVVFGEPRPAYVGMANKISGLPNRSYRNKTQTGHDLVTDVPVHIAPLFPFVHGGECQPNPRGFIDISAEPTEPDDWTIFRWHHSYLYQAGLLKLNSIATTEGITDIDCINLINSLYEYSGSLQVSWNHLDDGNKDDGVYWAALKMPSGVWAIVNRGSVDPKDFFRDGLTQPYNDRDLGWVHLGFFLGAKEQAQEVKTMVGSDPVVFIGHSLGAARAQIQTALALL